MGGGVTLERALNAPSVFLVYRDIPQESCVGLLARLGNTGANSGIQAISIGAAAAAPTALAGATVYTVIAAAPDNTISRADTAGCVANQANNDITVQLTIR